MTFILENMFCIVFFKLLRFLMCYSFLCFQHLFFLFCFFLFYQMSRSRSRTLFSFLNNKHTWQNETAFLHKHNFRQWELKKQTPSVFIIRNIFAIALTLIQIYLCNMGIIVPLLLTLIKNCINKEELFCELQYMGHWPASWLCGTSCVSVQGHIRGWKTAIMKSKVKFVTIESLHAF